MWALFSATFSPSPPIVLSIEEWRKSGHFMGIIMMGGVP